MGLQKKNQHRDTFKILRAFTYDGKYCGSNLLCYVRYEIASKFVLFLNQRLFSQLLWLTRGCDQTTGKEDINRENRRNGLNTVGQTQYRQRKKGPCCLYVLNNLITKTTQLIIYMQYYMFLVFVWYAGSM